MTKGFGSSKSSSSKSSSSSYKSSSKSSKSSDSSSKSSTNIPPITFSSGSSSSKIVLGILGSSVGLCLTISISLTTGSSGFSVAEERVFTRLIAGIGRGIGSGIVNSSIAGFSGATSINLTLRLSLIVGSASGGD
ncbi:MAG: hypothetical protein EAZ76_06540 [Nostocales cyanobacterium]|nr:MAG: hypothetical protein EAZ76_06540 [Nostocales cyanobacterium]